MSAHGVLTMTGAVCEMESGVISPRIASQMSAPQLESEDILYGDLEDAKCAAAPASDSTTTTSASTVTLSMDNQVKALECQVKRLYEENETLKRNMGILYRTAAAEIKRKDNEIENLTRQLESTRQERSSA